MDRRNFLKIGMTAAAVAGLPFGLDLRAEEPAEKKPVFSMDGNKISLLHTGLKKTRILVLADSHLTVDDERGEPYKDYSRRMAQYFNQSIPNLEKITAAARKQKYDIILMLGDMVSFPTVKGIETLMEAVKPLDTPFAYIAGNHDWHYEGEEGTEIELRKKWCGKALAPLYQDHNPLCYNVIVNGLNIVMMDTSVYEILPEQLDFWRAQAKAGLPILLGCHIPLWMPGRSVGWGVGHPDWNAAHDKNWQIERRLRWPERGHSDTTKAFHKEVLAAPNLLGVVAGHVHRQCYDHYEGKFQVTSVATGVGGSLEINLS